MTIVRDANSVVSATATFDYTPTGVLAGLLVLVGWTSPSAEPADTVSITAGGVPLEKIVTIAGGDGGDDFERVYAFFLGSGVPTGTLSIVVSGGGSRFRAVGYNADLDTEVSEFITYTQGDLAQGGIDSPTVGPLNTLGRQADGQIVWGSGKGNTGLISPISGWTSVQEYDMLDETIGFYALTSSPTNDSFLIGIGQTAENCSFIGVAVAEVIPDRIVSLVPVTDNVPRYTLTPP